MVTNDLQEIIVGDFEYKACYERASLITPVPGGLGPITVSAMMQNLVKMWVDNAVETRFDVENYSGTSIFYGGRLDKASSF